MHHLGINEHHDILSVACKPDGLLNGLLQAPKENVVDCLFQVEAPLPVDALLQNVVLEPQAPQNVVLGQECRLSESLLWQIQEDFYRNAGIDAWSTQVPCFITSSAYIAEAYAEMILAYVEDDYANLDLNEPVYILEMATGTGRFSHLLLRELSRKCSRIEALRKVRFRYVMTDFTDSNPRFWEAHEKLQPYLESGLLDFAVFNPLCEQSLTLRVSGETLSPGTMKNPMIAIANYFFDTIKQDFFRVESKRLFEGLVSLARNLDGVDPTSAPRIQEVTPSVRYRELPQKPYYEDDRLNAILKEYQYAIREGSIIFPVGAFDVVRNLKALSGDQLVLISSDKAFNCAEQMILFEEHTYAEHEGAFSYMVNYDALARYFANDGGHCFMTASKSLSLQTVCLVGLNRPDTRFERLAYLYEEKINRSHTFTSLCTLLPDERDMTPVHQMEQMLAYLRLNLADPKIFQVLGEKLVALIPQANWGQRQDLIALVDAAWRNFYFFPGEVNLPFCLSRIQNALGRFQESLDALDNTIRLFGPHEALYFLKGQNYEILQRWSDAADMYRQALALKPDCPESRQALDEVLPKIC